jgi:hypothetical protein
MNGPRLANPHFNDWIDKMSQKLQLPSTISRTLERGAGLVVADNAYPIAEGRALASSLADATRDVVGGVKDAIAKMDDLDLEIRADRESDGRTVFHAHLRAYRHREAEK